jgi:hypothetical protein
MDSVCAGMPTLECQSKSKILSAVQSQFQFVSDVGKFKVQI